MHWVVPPGPRGHKSVASALSSIIFGVLESRLPGKTPLFYTPRDAINIRRVTGRKQFGPDQSRGRYGGGNIGGSFGNAKRFCSWCLFWGTRNLDSALARERRWTRRVELPD